MKHQRWQLSGQLVIDVCLINLAFFLAYVIRYDFVAIEAQFAAPFDPYLPYAILLTCLCLAAYQVNGLYQHRRGSRWLDEVFRLFNGTTTSVIVVMAITFFVQPLVYSRGMLVLADFLIVLFLSGARLVERIVAAALRRRGVGVERVLIVGAGDTGRAVMRTLLADAGLGYSIMGYVDDDPVKGERELGRFKGLGGLDKVPSILSHETPHEVIVTLPWMYHRKIVQIIEECERKGIRVRVVPDVFQQRLQHVDLETLGGIPLIGIRPRRLSSTALFLKRALELTVIILSLPIMVPLFLLIAALIRIDSAGPIFFTQLRVGRDGREFEIIKFRSMVYNAELLRSNLDALNEADGPLFKIRDDPRRTRIGRFLRRTSLDELPQVLNIIRGEMSLIGPRPGTPDEVGRYYPWQRARLAVQPGITGLWQVSGRSDLPFDEMCLLDIYYIEHWSLDMDIRIMLLTIPRMLLGSGAY